MKLSDYLVEFISSKGTNDIFGYVGGAITHIVDSIDKNSSVQFIQTYHEQTAAIAAEGYSRISGRTGVAIATSGPGATNLITGIADAWFDSIPVVYITGQVNTYEYKFNKPVRQQGFQETDIFEIVKPITKYTELVTDAKKIRYVLEKAFSIANEGRPGPVLLDIPMDIQRADIQPQLLKGFHQLAARTRDPNITKTLALLSKAKRPILLAGGGVVKARAQDALIETVKKLGIPVVVSLMGKGCFPEDDPRFIGMIGSYGNRCANMAVANADLLLAVGSRLDTRQTGTALSSFVRAGKIIHIDIDPNELDHNRIPGRIKVQSDARTFLESLISRGKTTVSPDWMTYIAKLKSGLSQSIDVTRSGVNPSPYRMMEALNICGKDDEIYTIDIGQNQMFAAQMLKIRKDQSFFTSGGLAPMGYAVPLAVGAAIASEKKRVITAIAGDGGFHISTQALQLISQWNLPVRVVVLNNSALGMITQFQDLYFEERKAATTEKGGYKVPDIASIAKAYTLPYLLVTDEDLIDPSRVADKISNFTSGIIEVRMHPLTVVVPKLEMNRPIEEISPDLDEKIFLEHMLIPRFHREPTK